MADPQVLSDAAARVTQLLDVPGPEPVTREAGEQRGLQLAHSAITDVTKLGSVRVRRQLVPLAEALEADTVLGEHGKLVIREPEHVPADRREIGQQV